LASLKRRQVSWPGLSTFRQRNTATGFSTWRSRPSLEVAACAPVSLRDLVHGSKLTSKTARGWFHLKRSRADGARLSKMTEVRIAMQADEAVAIGVLALAFGADPVTRWTWPDPAQYLAQFPAFVKAFGGKAFTHGGAYLADGHAGAALWLPPGIGPDEDSLTALLRRTAPAGIEADIFALLEQMGRYHPSEPHWYLPLIGVDPTRQSRGYGSALMRHALAACDRDERPAYLESTNPRNIALY
jgi:GNAT superfamily N-acetyltransferase